MKYLEDNLDKEAEILFGYIVSASPRKISMPRDYVTHYIQASKSNGLYGTLHEALLRYPVLLGPSDAVSRLFAPTALLREKLYIATALFECSPSSANWLLPKDTSYVHLFLIGFLSSISFAVKLLAGGVLMVIPGFYKIYGKKNI
jgi:hypothetical protein